MTAPAGEGTGPFFGGKTKLRWWKPTRGDQVSPQLQAVRHVQVEHLDGRTTDTSTADEPGPAPAEMPFPLLPPRVEQRHDHSRFRFPACQIGAFGEITVLAAQGEVGGVIVPAVLLGNDVLDVEREEVIVLMHQTVFAPVVCPRPDQPARGGVHPVFRASRLLVSRPDRDNVHVERGRFAATIALAHQPCGVDVLARPAPKGEILARATVRVKRHAVGRGGTRLTGDGKRRGGASSSRALR